MRKLHTRSDKDQPSSQATTRRKQNDSRILQTWKLHRASQLANVAMHFLQLDMAKRTIPTRPRIGRTDTNMNRMNHVAQVHDWL
jgi:hypothetical protein